MTGSEDTRNQLSCIAGIDVHKKVLAVVVRCQREEKVDAEDTPPHVPPRLCQLVVLQDLCPAILGLQN
jgi:hypothetical protein